MEDLRIATEHLKQAKAHMSEANQIMNDHMSKLRELEEENAELKAKLELTCMELPLDADGAPIEVGDTVWSTYNGCKHIVMAVCSDGSLHPEISTNDGCMVEYEEGLWDFAKKVTHEQTDSWILWGADLDMAVKVGEVDKVERMRRAKALAKADSEARGVE